MAMLFPFRMTQQWAWCVS